MVMTESAITVRSNIPLMLVLILLTLGFLGMLRDILIFPLVTVENDGEAHNTDPNQAIHRRVSDLGSKKQHFPRTCFNFADFEISRLAAKYPSFSISSS
jgi:hypothetical protein